MPLESYGAEPIPLFSLGLLVILIFFLNTVVFNLLFKKLVPLAIDVPEAQEQNDDKILLATLGSKMTSKVQLFIFFELSLEAALLAASEPTFSGNSKSLACVAAEYS